MISFKFQFLNIFYSLIYFLHNSSHFQKLILKKSSKNFQILSFMKILKKHIINCHGYSNIILVCSICVWKYLDSEQMLYLKLKNILTSGFLMQYNYHIYKTE